MMRTRISVPRKSLNMEFTIEVIFVLFLAMLTSLQCKRVAIKIVEEPTNYGMNMGGYQNEEGTNKLEARIAPSNFSGPAHLKALFGICFEKTIESYKYELCPFHNITQHEQSLRWNPYSGVLGVWQEWVIDNNTFVAMVMGEGDSCGSVNRQTKVLLRCGAEHAVSEVSEPSTCHYELVFRTPFVCHPDSLLVYPTLPRALQHEWNVIEGKLQAQVITNKGYNKLLNALFEKAGYMLPESKKKQVSEAAKIKELNAGKPKEDTFDTLSQCQSEYKKLREEADGLRTLLRVNGIAENNPAAAHEEVDEHGPPGDYEQPHHYADYQWMHEDD